ncbi:MAG TPA: hypothetical protein VIC57_04245 [Candidatus Dormibacteraeota bacterium]|jgi:hypothetical protein
MQASVRQRVPLLAAGLFLVALAMAAVLVWRGPGLASLIPGMFGGSGGSNHSGSGGSVALSTSFGGGAVDASAAPALAPDRNTGQQAGGDAAPGAADGGVAAGGANGAGATGGDGASGGPAGSGGAAAGADGGGAAAGAGGAGGGGAAGDQPGAGGSTGGGGSFDSGSPAPAVAAVGGADAGDSGNQNENGGGSQSGNGGGGGQSGNDGGGGQSGNGDGGRTYVDVGGRPIGGGGLGEGTVTPELPSGVLFGLGLLPLLVALAWIRRRQSAARPE